MAALRDPDPRVAGKGFGKLRTAGIDLRLGVLEKEARQANIGFLTRMSKNRPCITLKLANSLDAKIATRTGESQWITGPQARAYVHMLRATHDAVMVGSGTSIADDPSLNVRLKGLESRHPVRIIIDSNLATPVDSHLGRSAKETPVWLCHKAGAPTEAWQKTGAKLIPCAPEVQHLSLPDALAKIADLGITRVFCEGGGTLAASLIRSGFVDRLITMTAGLAIGADGIANLAALGVHRLDQASRFKLASFRRLGDDLVAEWDAD